MRKMKMFTGKRFLVIGAHPDDPDMMFGGTAAMLAKRGHKIKFVSCCNGEKGHRCMTPTALAKRRYAETQASAAVVGLVEYQVLDNRDCELEATLEARRKITGIIRRFAPNIVISHRTCDYHADHRATAQLVQDASYLVTVPLYCPEIPVPESYPAFGYSWDHFQTPNPFRADAAVVIDEVISQKLAMLNCHESQFYEWLPWNMGYKDFDVNRMTGKEKLQWLLDNWICRNARQAELYSGNTKSKYLEAFERSEYGRQIAGEEFSALFSC